MDRSTTIRIEWGQISISYERLWEIADVLNVGVAELFVAPSVEPLSNPTDADAQGVARRTDCPSTRVMRYRVESHLEA